jgi:hypothetical protein
MTKEEIIAKAYGKYWEQVKNYVNLNGWVKITDIKDNNINDEIYNLSIDVIESPRRIRPKSLQGIENNNGWIKIESENDLPKEDVDYWVVNADGEIVEMEYFQKYKSFTEEDVSHYQPIVKPLNPIY